MSRAGSLRTGNASRRETSKPFREWIRQSSLESNSRIVLALDFDYRKRTDRLLSDARRIVKSTAKYLCAVKLNFHLITPLSVSKLRSLNDTISSFGLPSIADIKLNDIANTNRVATEYLWTAGFSAVIVNPFAGYEGGLDVVFERAKRLGRGVILLAYMSHKGADEGYGLVLKSGKTLHELFLTRAKSWGADGVIMGTTRPEKIAAARKLLGRNVLILSPGSGAQGGDPLQALKAGSDYLIFGRSIMDSEDPKRSARAIYESLLPSRASR